MEKRQPGLCCTLTWRGEECCQEASHKHTACMYGTKGPAPSLMWRLARLERFRAFPRQHTAPTLIGTLHLLSLACALHRMLCITARASADLCPRKSWNTSIFCPGHAPLLQGLQCKTYLIRSHDASYEVPNSWHLGHHSVGNNACDGMQAVRGSSGRQSSRCSAKHCSAGSRHARQRLSVWPRRVFSCP